MQKERPTNVYDFLTTLINQTFWISCVYLLFYGPPKWTKK